MREGTDNLSIQCPAGMGKTNMIFLLCSHLIATGKDFAIVTANQLLFEQMSFDCRLYFPDQDIAVVLLTGVDFDFAKDKILILDEADAMIDDCKVLIKEDMKRSNEVGGMVAVVKAIKAILISATFASHHQQFMRQVLDVKPTRMY